MTKTHIPTQATPAKGLSPQELGSQSEEEVRAADTTRMSQIFAERNANNPDGAAHAAAPAAPLAEEQLPNQKELEAQQRAIEHSQEINQSGQRAITIMEQDEQRTAQKLEATRQGLALEGKKINAPTALQNALFDEFVESGREATYHQAVQDRQKLDLASLAKLFTAPNPFTMTENKKAKMRNGAGLIADHRRTASVRKMLGEEQSAHGGA